MHLKDTPEQAQFRQEVRDFLRDKLPEDIRQKTIRNEPLSKEQVLQWQNILYKQGWGANSWPKEFGGNEWDGVRKYIFEEECALAGAPEQLPFGIKMVAPVIQKFGSKEQQEKFLPRILRGEDWWCQGYSEPNAGSDLASLTTRAVREGDHYIVNGMKTWNTLGQHADWIFCLVRTNTEVKKQAGISFLLIDMKTPGITIRPIVMLDGTPEVNEVFFDNVKVPVENRVGEEDKGWTYAKFLLGHERTNIARVGVSKAMLDRIKAMARKQPGNDGKPLIEDPRFRDRLARVELRLKALEIVNLKVISTEGKIQTPGPEASMLKLIGTEVQQEISDLGAMALGGYGVAHREFQENREPIEAFPDDYVYNTGRYFNLRKTTIYGGSSEVQRLIICRLILGL